jgi:ABC-type lipoprotein release transport system permease subunit
MLFLLGIYRGVAEGSVEYIRQNKADLWILQTNTTNILRGTSILSTAHGYVLRENPDLKNISPVLFLLSTIKKQNKAATVFLTGYDPAAKYGGPPGVIQGRNINTDHEIVLDVSFAAKHSLSVGDTVFINHTSLVITGLCTGTNAFVIQYAFVTLKQAQSLIEFNNLITCYCADVKTKKPISAVCKEVEEDVPGIVVYTHQEFLQNNIYEMESGILPLLYALAAIGSIVLTVILTLILSINILEYRTDFAVMKTLGSPFGYLPRLIINQAFFLVASAIIIGLIFFFPMVALICKVSPEIKTITSVGHIFYVIIIVGIMSLVSAFVALRKLRNIYPLEVFE